MKLVLEKDPDFKHKIKLQKGSAGRKLGSLEKCFLRTSIQFFPDNLLCAFLKMIFKICRIGSLCTTNKFFPLFSFFINPQLCNQSFFIEFFIISSLF